MRNSEKILLVASVAIALLIGATSLMPPEVYASWWWMLLWALVAAGLIVAIFAVKLWRRPLLLLLHLSFLLMIAGGGATAFLSFRGNLKLTPHIPTESFIDSENKSRKLPVALTLQKFEPEYYPGMTFPKDFHSNILTAEGKIMHISMNNIGKIGSWRFYQASYTPDGDSILTVSHDPFGIALTYSGYALFALAGAWLLIGKLWRHSRQSYKANRILAIGLLLCGVNFSSMAAKAVPQALADSLEMRQVIFRGKVMPFAAMASQLTYKLTGKNEVAKLNPTRFVASLITYPEDWRVVPFIKVKSGSVLQKIPNNKGYVAIASLYSSEGRYLPQSIYEGGSGQFDKALLQLDEKVAILGQLWSGELFTPLPDGSNLKLSTPEARSAVTYAHIQPTKWWAMALLAAGVISMIAVAITKKHPLRWLCAILFATGLAIFLWRSTIEKTVPLAGAGDILFFVSVMLTGVCALWCNRAMEAAAGGLLMAGFAALASWLNLKDPSLTPLMPVLHSPWLSVHVALVMTSYAFLAFTLPISFIAFALPSRRETLAKMSIDILMPGVYLLGLGIWAGAMWANISWGRYWAWDPKETWALVTMILYAIPLHRSVGLQRSPIALHVYLALAFLSIIMTYWGVNYLPSIHAYQ